MSEKPASIFTDNCVLSDNATQGEVVSRIAQDFTHSLELINFAERYAPARLLDGLITSLTPDVHI